MRLRIALLTLAAALLAAPAPALASRTRDSAAPAHPSWAQAEIKLVVAHGLLGSDVASFRPDDPLTEGDLAQAVAALSSDPTFTVSGTASTPVTIAQLDAGLVHALGLEDAAAEFYRGVRAAGLLPPARFGTEAVARLLGLRLDHPAAQEALELRPQDPATRAEAAYSIAQILRLQGWEVPFVKRSAASFSLPQLTLWQARVLETAVWLIGYPYVWGGTSDNTQAPLGKTVPGGFDCSGFAWRVYKSQPYAGGDRLASVLRGRSSYAMSGEVPSTDRIGLRALQPADLLFFGRGPHSKPAQIDHVGIYLGNGWLIQSSGFGVAISPLEGWYSQRFAWARRPIAEAGLEQ